MTDRECQIEILCCTPIELLVKRIERKCDEIPEWLVGIPDELIVEAREKYYDPAHQKKREEMLQCI